MKKAIVILAIIAIGIGFAISFKQQAEISNSPNHLQPSIIPTIKPTTAENEQHSYKFTAEKNEQTAFELLQKNAEVEYDEYDFGIMIQAINQLASNNDYYWALYVNGEYAQQGAKQTVLKQGDEVEFRYEKIRAQ